jgi:hypothetical protein
VRIVVHVLLALESLALLLQLVAEHDVQVFSLIRSLLVPNAIHVKLWVVGILHTIDRVNLQLSRSLLATYLVDTC